MTDEEEYDDPDDIGEDYYPCSCTLCDCQFPADEPGELCGGCVMDDHGGDVRND